MLSYRWHCDTVEGFQHQLVHLKEGCKYQRVMTKVQGEGLAGPSAHHLDDVEGDTFE